MRKPFWQHPAAWLLWVVVVITLTSSTAATLVHGEREQLLGFETLNFDFGWKFRTGLHAEAHWDDPPPVHPDPGVTPKESLIHFDDSTWTSVQLPHDGIIGNPPSQRACPNGCSGRSYIPRHVLWYRKTFRLPQSWLGSDNNNHDDYSEVSNSNNKIWLEFSGSFRNTTVWLNGKLVKQHVCGYTPFRVDIPTSTAAAAATTQDASFTLAVFVDPDNGDNGGQDRGSGWWYEGGGLYRHVTLHKAPLFHIVPSSFFVKSFPTSKNIITKNNNNQTNSWKLQMEATIANTHLMTNKDVLYYNFVVPSSLVGMGGGDAVVVSVKKDPVPNPAENNTFTKVTATFELDIPPDKLWSTSSPKLHQMQIVLSNQTTHKEITLDQQVVQHGFRSLHFDANTGFYLNGQRYKIRGFCDHDTFAVLGMALPDRVNLFRAQASRSIGGNARRTSHNPPDPPLLDMYDRLGMVVIDENRLFDNNTAYVQNFADLVTRDRNHPSVVVWSFCNERWCEGEHEAGGPAFQNVATSLDGSRPTLANMFTFNDLLSNTVDVQGFSHQLRPKLDDCHKQLPNKPILMSECCSCNTMRGEDEGCETTNDNPHKNCTQKEFNARCLQWLVNASDGVEYAAGTMVWTLLDYYGEPPFPPRHVSSTYGQFDLCGFPKAAGFWFRTQWLLGVQDDRQDKTFPTHNKYEVLIVESWESPDTWEFTKGNTSRTIHAYSNAPYIRLEVNGKAFGPPKPVVPMNQGKDSYAEFKNVNWEPGAITATALDTDQSKELAKMSRTTNGPKADRLVLSLDCPSPLTGTGIALFADGQDVALVRATIVDEHGIPMHMATNNVTFRVKSGPGRVVGTANGDPASYQPHTSSSQTAYHGLVRAVVQITSISGLSSRARSLLQESHDTNSVEMPSMSDTSDIVIEASSPEFATAQLTIPVSSDPSASVLAVAAASAGKPVDFFQDGPTMGAVSFANPKLSTA